MTNSIVYEDYASNIYDDNRENVTLYMDQFGKYPSRAVFQRLTKGFEKNLFPLLDLEILIKDFGFSPKNLRDIDKTIYLDKKKEILVIKFVVGTSIVFVLHFSNTESNLNLIDKAIKLSKKHHVRVPKKIMEPMIELVILNQGELDTIRRKFAFQQLSREELAIHYGRNFLDVYDKLQEFLEAHRKLVLLHGEPGTGKSTLLKQLIAQKNDRLLYFSPENIKLLGTPDFTKFLLQHTGKIIIAEDAENILVDVGTRSAATANLLNLTDGILAEIYNCGLLATFNTHISNLDSALIRPGRLFLQHELKALNVDEANTFLEYKNSSKRVNQEMTLAELFFLLGE